MAPTTPEEWLPILAKRLDEQSVDIAKVLRYSNGKAPLPEGGRRAKPTWIAFQKKALTNFGAIACASRANRIRYRDVTVAGDPQGEASVTARRIARDNRLPMQIRTAVWNMLTARRGYLVSGAGDDSKAVITAERPELFYAEPDPIYPWKVRAAIKVWRDTIEVTDHALVWIRGLRQEFVRPSHSDQATQRVRITAVGGWSPLGEPDVYDGDPPVWILDRDDGLGFVEPHTDLIDRLNTMRLERLSVMAIQAFRQRAIKKDKDAPPLPEVDQSGKPFDLAGLLEAAPGVFWDLPEGYEIWESTPTDIRQMLEAEKEDTRSLAAVLGVNWSIFMPDSANQSATGAEKSDNIEVSDCEAMIDRITLAVVACLLTSLRIEGVEPEGTIEVNFVPPASVTMAEQFDALTKGQSTGMALETLQKYILGWSADMIAEDAANRARVGALTAMASLTRVPAAANQQAPTAADDPEQSEAEDIKRKADAMGVLIRAGVDPADAADRVGLSGVRFRPGLMPASLVVREGGGE